MGSRGFNRRLRSIWHNLHGKIVLQLDDWGPSFTLGVYHFLLYPPGKFLNSLCIVMWSFWELSNLRIQCICLLGDWSMLHPLPLWGLILVPYHHGHIFGINNSLTCVVSVFHWSGGPLIWLGWLGVGLGWLGVWIWRLIVCCKLLGPGWCRVIYF